MGKITSLRTVGKGRIKVFIDGLACFTIGRNDASSFDLKIGKEILGSRINKIKKSATFQECVGVALHFLSYRPRSEEEVRIRLRQRCFEVEVVDKVIYKLKQQKLVDDIAFAKYWTENRLSFRPKSKAMLSLELRRKGIETQIVEDEISNLDDEVVVYRAASKIVWKLESLGQDEFYRRLTSYLRRRGFNYDVIKEVIKKLWSGQSDTF